MHEVQYCTITGVWFTIQIEKTSSTCITPIRVMGFHDLMKLTVTLTTAQHPIS